MNDPTIQYQGLTAPLMPPRPHDVGAGWMGSCLPPTRRIVPIALMVGLSVLPLQPPSSEVIAAEWEGSAIPPTRRVWDVSRTVQASVIGTTLAEGTANPPTSWRPRYPDVIFRKPGPQYHKTTFGIEVINANPGSPGGAIIATGSVPILQYQSVASPFNDTPAPAFTDQIFSARTDLVYGPRSLHPSLIPFVTSFRFDAPEAATLPDLSWSPQYPSRLHRVRQTPISASDLAPTFATFIDLNWRPIYPNQHLVVRNNARYVWPHPYFIVEVDVPVMSWTGMYLDPPVRRKPRVQPNGVSGPLEPSLLSESTAPPEHAWDGVYPERVLGFRRSPAAMQTGRATGPYFVPDLTNPVTVLSWQGRYADRVPGPKRTVVFQAFSIDRFTAPTPVVVPDLAAPVYPHRVYGKALATWAPDMTAPDFVPDVTQPVRPLSWLARYADLVWPQTSILTAAQLALMIDAQIAPPIVVATPAKGHNRIGIPRRQRLAAVRGHQRIVRVSRVKRDE